MATVALNGNTYADNQGEASRFMSNGGHRTWFFPLLSDLVADLGSISSSVAAASASKTAAETAESNASTSAGNASVSAGQAAASQTAAENAATAAAGSVGGINVSADDTTPGNLELKLLAGNHVSLATGNPGGNETRTINVSLSGNADGAIDLNGNALTVDFATVEAAGEHAEENAANATGTVTIQATDPTVLRRTLTGDVTLHVAGAPTPGKGWSTELRTTQDGTGGRDLTILPVNLLTYSEQFDNAAWTKSNASVTANTTTAPNGKSAADTITDTSGAAFGFVQQLITVANDSLTRTVSVYLKQGTATASDVTFGYTGGTGVETKGRLTYSTGVDSVVSGSGSVSVETLADDWYRISITQANNSSGNTSAYVQILADATSISGTGTCIAWGAQLVPGSDPLGYIAVGATRAASVVWRAGAANAVDYTAQAAATESRIILGIGSDGEIMVDDVSVEA